MARRLRVGDFAAKFARYAREVGWRRAGREWVRTVVHVSWQRTVNRWRDIRAVSTGYCNHRPWSPIPGQGGGYSHWRCALRRGHVEDHRSRNYTWIITGRTTYDPVPIGERMPRQPWDRYMTPTMRQTRTQRRWYDAKFAERRAARFAAGTQEEQDGS